MAGEMRANYVTGLYDSLDILPPPGLSSIKEHDLGNKVSRVVPEAFKSHYPKPSDAAVAKVKKRKQEKHKRKKEAQEAKKQKVAEYNGRPVDSKTNMEVEPEPKIEEVEAKRLKSKIEETASELEEVTGMEEDVGQDLEEAIIAAGSV